MTSATLTDALDRLAVTLDTMDQAVDQTEKKMKAAKQKGKNTPQMDLFASPPAVNDVVPMGAAAAALAASPSHLDPDMIADRLARAIAQIETVLDQAA